MSDFSKMQNLRNCFYSGYNLAMFCVDNSYKKPLVISDFPEILYEAYTQFTFSKLVSADYRIIGNPTTIDYSYACNLGVFRVKSIEGCDFSNYDVAIIMTDQIVNIPSSLEKITLDSLIDRISHYVFIERPIYNFIQHHPGVKVITYSHAPLNEDENLTEQEKKILTTNFKKDLLDNVNTENVVWTPLDGFGYNNTDVLKLLETPKTSTDLSGCTYFEDSENDLFNIKDGKRQTAYQTEKYDHTMFCIGTCVCVGYAAPYDKTMLSFLQKKFNENNISYKVENCSQFFNGRYQDSFYNLNSLPVKDGDIVFICISNRAVEDVPCFSIKNLFKRPHDYGEIYVDKNHINEKGYEIVANKVLEFLNENKWFEFYDYNTDKITRTILHPHMYGIPEWVDDEFYTYKISEDLKEYKNILRYNKNNDLANNAKIGSIVMNCNPFTKGHRYLIETASKQVDQLYVFVVEEDKSIFPFKERFSLVKNGVKDLKNVTVIPSGKFIISSLTFSDYFNKSNLQEKTIDPSMDVEIFAKLICPELGIKIRFAGEEPLDLVTKQYNETMNKILPQYGIEFIEIPRITFGEGVISASRVRKLLKENKFEEIKQIVPSCTYDYLLNKYSSNNTQEQTVESLDEIEDLNSYIDKLTNMKNLIVFMAAKDTYTCQKPNNNTHKLESIFKLGINEKMEEQFRFSHLSIIDSGNIKFSKSSENERIVQFYKFNENTAMMISEGFNARSNRVGEGKVIINKKLYSLDKRGLNFVIWNKDENKVIDSVCFDILKNKVYRNNTK